MSDNHLSHDPHLRAALRHAPDHALVPPAGVSQTILNAARQVHKPARPAATPAPAVRITAARPRALAWLHQWFASPRLAGSLATGLVAALGLGLWIDLGREPVIERAPAPSAQQLRSSGATPAAPATEPGGPDANAARDAQHAPAAPPVPSEAPRAKRAERATEARIERHSTALPAAQQPPPAPAAAPERHEDSVAREAEPALAKSAPPAAARAAPAEEPAPAVADPPAAPTADARAAADAPQRDAAAKSDQRMSLAAGRAAAVAGARASALESSSAGDTAAASPAFTLLRRARGESAANSARWRWMPPGSPLMGAFDDVGQAWLARVVQATQGRWSDTPDRAGPGNAVEARWWRDDWPQATLRIEADGVRWIEHNGRVRHAPLDAATLQRLRSL